MVGSSPSPAVGRGRSEGPGPDDGPAPRPERDGAVRRRTPPLAVAGFALATLAGVVLSADIAGGPAILGARWGILGRLALWSVAWLVALACVGRLPRRAALVAIVTAGVALRLAALAGPPPLSDDLFRYSWDGRVQLDGTNPYRYVPEDPALGRLREGWLWPDAADCAEIDRPPGCTRINRPAAHTIYPPLAELWFGAVHGITGIDAHHKSWQVAGLVTDMALIGLLAAALRRRGADPRWVALYALSPFPVVEVVANGHVDGLAALLLVAALAVAGPTAVRAAAEGHGAAGGDPADGHEPAAEEDTAAGRDTVVGRDRRDRRGRRGRRIGGPGWAGALVGAAALIKLYPAVALVGLAGAGGGARRAEGSPDSPGGNRSRWSALLRAGLAFALVVVVGYLPHVAAVGARVAGYLPGYLEEERYDEGGRFLLIGLLAPSPTAARVGAVLAMAGVVAWVVGRRPDPAVAFAALLGGLLLVTTPVQPWYAVSLLAVATLARRPAWVAVAAGGYPYFFAVILDHPDAVAIGRWGYGLALAAVAATAASTATATARAALTRRAR